MIYPSDLTDSQWELIEPVFKRHIGRYGNRAKWPKRLLVDAVLYLVKTGCQWRMLPKEYPSHNTVHAFFRRMRLSGIWEEIVGILVAKTRVLAGRCAYPSYVIVDSQSVKTTGSAEERGIDGGKKRKVENDT
jgi:putative transposase